MGEEEHRKRLVDRQEGRFQGQQHKRITTVNTMACVTQLQERILNVPNSDDTLCR